MNLSTLSLCLCTTLALTRAIAIPGDYCNDNPPWETSSDNNPITVPPPSDEGDKPAPPPSTDQPTTTTPPPPTTPPPNPDDNFGGWSPSCPNGWQMFSIRCLLYIQEKMSYDSAEGNCRSNGGTLVAAVEQFGADIQKVLQSGGHMNGHVWVKGCSTDDHSWDWSTFDFSDYGHREPSCIRITSGVKASACLNRKQCEASLPSICSIIIM
ncbi:mucin-2-like [Xyrichtys novacula]|uniref:Mucin-2-like n=1 Tax=Xyrichtys novacula TaxID=13765 RepID=A0AAV1G6J9_XYRNO|nr:mucin-2-like [Xyrichtys novacula]